ncbi:MAG: protein kinase [Archangium gephyra]|uniref:Protein kinase n=1 Tax=Archangium gephyra TaxID=48 RepID=A0A2W5TG93_9BACT|nr:MAG: protein kinase [Archangium gephyra]
MKKPSVFGKYLLLERLNVGGMAEVFAAKAFGVEGFERILAIKKILPTMAEDEEFITMFIDEARISVQLNHANVVHIHELGKHDDAYYIAMEYVSGKDLRALLERFRRRKEIMPTAMAVFCATKICEGLDYAHRKKDARGQELHIIHRDVSPQNILISYEGEVKIIDFGIAKAANRSQKTQAGILKGKFGYMSPEQVRGLPIDRRSDVFAVGVILYEMLTGEKLFVGESDFSTLEKVRNAEVPTPRQFNPNIPAGLEKVVMKALAREAEDRYQWSSDLQEDLMRFLLAGDAIYSAKHLSSFMKDAFAEDLLRENEKMERFASVERPDQVEASGITASPTRSSAPNPPRRNTQQPGSLATLSGGGPARSRSLQGVAVATGSGAVAMGLQSSKIDIPPPTDEELAEMDGAKDRTVIVDNSVGANEEGAATAIGISPFGGKPAAPQENARQLRPSAPTSGNSTTQDNLPPTDKRPSGGVKSLRDLPADETIVPTPRSSLVDEDTGSHDLRPIEMTGFRPALEVGGDDSTGNQPAMSPSADQLESTMPPRQAQGRAKIVIGDAPVGGATSIGPSPFAKNETRMYETGEGEEGAEEEQQEEPPQDEENYDDEQQHDEPLDDDAPHDEEEAPAEDDDQPPEEDEEADVGTAERPQMAKNARKPSGRTAQAAPADGKRKVLLIAIVATAVLALVVLGAAALKFLGGPKSGAFVTANPKDVPYTIVIKPGDIRVENPSKTIELDPGEYTFEFKPSVPGYLTSKKSYALKAGKTTPIMVTFTKAEQDPVAVKNDGPPAGDSATNTPPKNDAPTTDTAPKVDPAAPALWTAIIGSDEPGVDISLDGKVRGQTPVLVKDLAMGKTYEFTAKKSGFETVTFSMSNPDKLEKIEKQLTMKSTRADPVAKNDPPPKKEPEPAPVAKNDPPPKKDPAPTPAPKNDPPPKKDPAPTPVARTDPPPPAKKDPPKSKATGLAVFASRPLGAEVWIDGKNTGKKTPVPKAAALELSVGAHKVQFKLNGKSSETQSFTVTEDKSSPVVVKGEL